MATKQEKLTQAGFLILECHSSVQHELQHAMYNNSNTRSFLFSCIYLRLAVFSARFVSIWSTAV